MKRKIAFIAIIIAVTFLGIKIVSAGSNLVFSNNVTIKKGMINELGKGLAKYSKGYMTYTVNEFTTTGAHKVVFEPYLKVGSSYVNKGSYVENISENPNVSKKIDVGNIGIGEWKLTARAKITGGDICAGWKGKVTLTSTN